MFEDALTALKGDPAFWVTFEESVWLEHEDRRTRAFVIYHWLLDIHIFYVDEYGATTPIIAKGPIDDSDWHYSTDPSLVTAFIKTLHRCRDRLQILLVEEFK